MWRSGRSPDSSPPFAAFPPETSPAVTSPAGQTRRRPPRGLHARMAKTVVRLTVAGLSGILTRFPIKRYSPQAEKSHTVSPAKLRKFSKPPNKKSTPAKIAPARASYNYLALPTPFRTEKHGAIHRSIHNGSHALHPVDIGKNIASVYMIIRRRYKT